MSSKPHLSHKNLGNVRPTTGKVKESLTATLAPYWEGARVLDLFAGSGSLGQAALDHGVSELVLVEGHTRVARQLSRDFKGCTVIAAILPLGLQRLEGSFDLVLADPPYGDPAGPATLAQLGPWVHDRTIVVFEHHHKDKFQDDYGFVKLWRRKRFGETALSYYAGPAIAADLAD